MKVKIRIKSYPAGLISNILTKNESETLIMKTGKTQGTWFSYETTKTIPQVVVAFAAEGYDLDEFVSVRFWRG